MDWRKLLNRLEFNQQKILDDQIRSEPFMDGKTHNLNRNRLLSAYPETFLQ